MTPFHMFYQPWAGVLGHDDDFPPSPFSDRLPSTIVDVSFELPADEAKGPVAEPKVTQHRVVAFLMEKQLPEVAQSHVDLSVSVNVRSVAERARRAVEIEDVALADVDK